MPAFINRLLQPVLEPFKKHRRSQFETLPRPRVDVVFVGDSITEGGVWDEWFPTIRTANRGIAGETSVEVVKRLDSLVAEAKLAFILIGTNDLSLGIKEETIAANVRAVVAHLEAVTPGVVIVIQSVMPRKKAWSEKIRSLNLRLQGVAAETGSRYLDLWPALAGADGAIRPELSLDGLHLNGDGYRLWVDQITPLLVEAGLVAGPETLSRD